MHFKLAILNALARRPDGRATLGEVRREVEVLSANQDQAPATEDLSALRDIDIFQSGLVVADGRGLQITDAGRSLLDALETFSEPSIPPVSSSSSKSLELIDDLIGTGRRPKLIDLERRKLDEQADFKPIQQQASDGSDDAKSSAADSGVVADGHPEIDASRSPHRADPDQTVSENSQLIAIDPADRIAGDAPAFLTRSLGSELQTDAPKVSHREKLVKAIAAGLRASGPYLARPPGTGCTEHNGPAPNRRDWRRNVCDPDRARRDDLRRRVGRTYPDQIA